MQSQKPQHITKQSVITGSLLRLQCTYLKTLCTSLALCLSMQNIALAKNDHSQASLLQATERENVTFNDKDMQRYGSLWQRIQVGSKLNPHFEHRRIDQEKGWFITRQQYMNKMSARASNYLYYTVAEAERRGIPSELALLPIIESSYDPTATSNAQATGMWQFIPSTGRIYGLKQTKSYDGRRDVIESTRAAYDFLTSLYNKFGSWELALAAYNAGPSVVQQAIDKNKAQGYPTDYWSISLPKETMQYVPRFLAIANIINNPFAHGIVLPEIANRPFFKSVPVANGISMAKISKITGVDSDTLYNLNPALLQGYTSTDAPNRILLPTTVNDSVNALLVNNQNSNNNTNFANNRFKTYVDIPPNIESSSTTNNNELTAEVLASRKEFYNKKTNSLPKTASELANFASNAHVIDQTPLYISIKPTLPPITTLESNNYTPYKVSKQPGIHDSNLPFNSAKVTNKPAISTNLATASELAKQEKQEKMLSDMNVLPTSAAKVTKNETVVAYPALSKQEVKNVVKDMQRANPNITNIIDPLDGEIKLEAIQTQHSILAAQGKQKTLTYKAAPRNTKSSRRVRPKSNPKGKRTVYKVRKGDTLKQIAQQYGVYWRDLARWNDIDYKASLYVGTPLYLYGAKKSTIAPQKKPTMYRVQPGDTMIGLANEFGMKPSVLAKINNMKALDGLIIGQRLHLVAKKNQSHKNNQNKAYAKKSTYRVKSGDSMISVARKFKMKPTTLAKMNGMRARDNLKIGQRLTLVKGKTSHKNKQATSTYKVKSGDGLIQLAKRFNVTTTELAALNNISKTKKLFVGQRLKVPANTSSSKQKTSQSRKKKSTQSKNNKPSIYIVERGDTIIYVARKFKVSTNNIAKWNGITRTSALRIGQRLKLSETVSKKAKKRKKGYTNYKVKSGDGLIALARRYKTSVKKIATLNNISPKSSLKRGQTLKIPK